MKVTITGKQIDVGEALRGHVETCLYAAVDKYFDRAIEAQVTFSRDGGRFRADISVHAGRGILLQGHAAANDAYLAFDRAEEHIAKRLRRYKRRLRDRKPGEEGAAPNRQPERAPQYILAEDSHTEAEIGDQPVIVAEMTTQILSLTVGEAVMHMDLADQPALLFRNSAHGGLNMIYRRPDGNIGWVNPPPEGQAGRPGKA